MRSDLPYLSRSGQKLKSLFNDTGKQVRKLSVIAL